MAARSKSFVKSCVLFQLVFYVQMSSAVIYNLNETEYKKMPPVFHLEPYQECMQDPEGVYCATELVLVSDNESLLLDMILEYSAYTTTHYNHSLIRYNLCITNTCKEYYDNTTDLVDSLEACLNKTFHEQYGLKIRVLPNIHCKNANEKTKIEVADICMFALIIGILGLNIVGSLYDFIYTNGQTGQGIRIFTYFAIRRNWRKLVAPALDGPESRLKRLKGLSGIKFSTMLLMIAFHSLVFSAVFIENTKFSEDLFNSGGIQFLLGGSIVVQTFFLMSGFLLAYNLELMSEKETFTVNWTLLPKGMFLRWIRLTPIYAVLIFFTVTCSKYLVSGSLWHFAVMAEVEDCKKYWWQLLLYIYNYNDDSQCLLHTWLTPIYAVLIFFTVTCSKYLVSGSLWHFAVMAEVEDCKKYWWQLLLYIYNYNDDSQCLLHTWYLSSDTQLYCLGLAIYIVCRTAISRKVVLSLLLLVAIAIPAGHTYWQDLDGVVIGSPEDTIQFFVNNKTFNYLHKRGHTNMFSYLVGMIVGFLAHHGQKINYDVQRFRKYRILYYAMVPLGAAILMSATIFFRDGQKPSLAVRVFFSVYQKPVWCLFLGVGILGLVFKYEDFLRGLAEWRGWTALSRLSYCAYLLHVTVIRHFLAMRETTAHVSVLSGSEQVLHIIAVSYILAFLCWMLVEQPFSQLMKIFLPAPAKKEPCDTLNGTKKVTVDIASGDKNNIVCEEQLTRV